MAAALVIPAISSLHGLVVASSHINGAVDMDIFGAFQFCAIGILAAPLTVRLSRTYFYDPGRNIIFLWTILILMGLVALCVEFYRVTPTACPFDELGNPISLNAAKFPYAHASCGLVCSEDRGPFSSLRGGANGNVYIIPVPKILSFNAAMLLAAGFCIPAILSLVFTWDKILEINWKRRTVVEQQLDAPIEGANITVREMKGINNVVRKFLSVVEIPLFGGVILAIIGIGEANFFSSQVSHEIEPMASIGQWSSIAGTALAALGSLYLLWSTGDEVATEKPRPHYANSAASHRGPSSERQRSPARLSNFEFPISQNPAENGLGIRSTSPNAMARIPTITQPDLDQDHSFNRRESGEGQPTAGRNTVRKWLNSAADYLGNAAHDKFDVSDYKNEKARGFPEVPGEVLRNPALERISTQYSRLREENSRAGSTYAPSIASTSGIEGSSTPPPPLHESPRPETSPARKPKRRDTLEVPAQVHGHRRSESNGEPT